MSYTKEQRRIYNIVYNERLRNRRRHLSSIPIDPEIKPVPEPLPLKYEPVYCSSFGCGKILSSTEALFGRKCTGCQNEKKPDVISVIKFR